MFSTVLGSIRCQGIGPFYDNLSVTGDLTLMPGRLFSLRHQECLSLRVQNDNRFEILTVSPGRQLSKCAEQDLTDLPEKDLPG